MGANRWTKSRLAAVAAAFVAVLAAFFAFARKGPPPPSPAAPASAAADSAAPAPPGGSGAAAVAPAVPDPAADPRIAAPAAKLRAGSAEMETAAGQLVALGTPEALRALVLGILNQPPSPEAYRALHALGNLRDRAAARWIMDLLAELSHAPEHELHYKMICSAIGMLATASDVDELIRRANSAADTWQRELHLSALASVRMPDAAAPLMRAAQLEDWKGGAAERSVSVTAAKALGSQGSVPAVEFLLAQFEAAGGDSLPPLEGLSRVKAPGVVPLLIQVAEGTHPKLTAQKTRLAATSMLGQINHEAGWQALQRLGSDTDPALAEAARQTLRKVSNRTGVKFR